MARIVIVTPYFWPDIAASVPLMTSLCEDLSNYGHNVSVLTHSPGKGLEKETKNYFKYDFSSSGCYKGVRVIRFSNCFFRFKGMLAKILEYLAFTIWATLMCCIMSFRTDIFFISSNPPLLGLPIYYATRLGRSKVVYNLQDLFPDSAVSTSKLKKGTIYNFFKFIEKKNYDNTTVTVISEEFKQYVKRISKKTDVYVIPNWVDTEKVIQIKSEDNWFLKKLNIVNKFVVLYAGNLGFAQNIDVVLKAAKLLRNYKDIYFVIVGDGQQKENVVRTISAEELKNIILVPFEAPEDVAYVYSSGDIGLVTTLPGIGRSAVPSKTWSIMACGKPVVACIDEDSTLATIVRESCSGMVIEPDNEKMLASAILEIYQKRSYGIEMGKKGRRFVVENISRNAITAKYCKLFNEI